MSTKKVNKTITKSTTNSNNKTKKVPVAKLGILQKYSLFFFDRVKLTFTVWVAILLFGFITYSQLIRREGFPSVQVPISTVNAGYFVNDKSRVDSEIALPISNSLGTIDEVKKISTVTTDNFMTVVVSYDDGVDSQKASKLVEQKIASLSLPEQAIFSYGLIDAAKFDNKYNLIVSLFATDDVSDFDKLESATTKLSKELESVSGIQKATLIEQTKAAQNPLTGEQQKIQNSFEFVGYKDSDKFGFSKAVNIGINFNQGTDELELSDAISSKLSSVSSESFMVGYKAIITSDQAPQVTSQIASLQRNMIEGLIIVAIISFALVTWRAGLSTSLSMITVLLSTVSLLYFFGMSLNTITLFSLILSLGLIVDDSTIIGEAVDALKSENSDRREVVKQAIGRVARASTAGTLTTIMAFAPMLFISGILGEFIIGIPITIIISLVLSLVVSLSMIPFFSRGFLLGSSSHKDSKNNPVQRLEKLVAHKLASLIRFSGRNKKQGAIISVVFIALSFCTFFAGGMFFSKIGFDIFPKEKDSISLIASVRFRPGSSITEAESQSKQVNDVISKYGNFVESVTYMNSASTQSADLFISLTPLDSRDVTSIQIAQNMQNDLNIVTKQNGSAAVVSSAGAGGPSSDFPVEIKLFNKTEQESKTVIEQLTKSMENSQLVMTSGKNFSISKFLPTDDKNLLLRQDGKPYRSVKIGFDTPSSSELITLASDFIKKEVESGKYNISPSDIAIDTGQEDENQKSFQSMMIAFPILLIAMYVLLAFQFKSLLQPLFIFTAIPFSFLGVGAGLYLTNNSASFFVMIGFFALIGVSLNNTILITDYANQGRARGLGRVESIAQALEQRFRPLLTTSITSVVALIPLALTDPFWQSLSVTLIFGLLSSTLLVVLCFPYYLIAAETLRAGTRKSVIVFRSKLSKQ
jgi:multidrug efflux pump subunit AcrB